MALRLLTMTVGALLLFAGRRLYWVYVGAAGFLIGIDYAPMLFRDGPPWASAVAAIGLGLAFAIIAVFARYAGAALAGFAIGARFGAVATAALGLQEPHVLAVAIAVIGGLAAILVYDPALVVLSSLAGAVLVTDGLGLGEGTHGTAWILGWTVFGVLAQTRRTTAPSATAAGHERTT